MTIFTTVMRLGSVTAAATALGMAQPSVSKSIALMEHRLGFRLFERVRGRLMPTAEAALVLEEAMRIEEELSRFDRYLNDVRHLRTGQLRVAATPALALNLLPPVARAMRRELPDYGLALDMHLNHEIPGLVERGQYDVGLAVIPTADEREGLSVIRRGRIVCVLPATHPLAGQSGQSGVQWEQMDPAELIYITTDARLVMLLAAGIPDFLHRRQSATETNRYSIAIHLVRQGMGITLVDEFTMIGADREGLAVRPFEPELGVSLVMALGGRRIARKAVERFIASIHAMLDA
ncbi:LysR family transcriptional regulator [Ancylobacter sonchi]|uniref:LysR family transcriptional regulator n=1 Tax=Ancylobacter sonchi TaxID=1937790 RepID=UPI001BD58467|nr:LysR substrate-binding domain-containing protein [Ancylobacter sonchi]MBS7532508.1 LysR family transcriptional regulator [Ancylobacter sonchi]